MSFSGFSNAARTIAAHIAAMPEFVRLVEIRPDAGYDPSLIDEILGAAAALAEGEIAPFGRQSDHDGCRLAHGRVVLAPGHHAAWAAFVEGGWTGTDGAAEHGGMGLPMVLHSACEELFNRASPGFGMVFTPMRCAARVIEKYADDGVRDEWLPRLIAGQWGATICISEADAGSDVPRLRTIAEPQEDGAWAVTGEKMWISFGDHDLTEQIGHMVLARCTDPATGVSGLSLFLVPSIIDGRRNAVVVRRIEEKLGLHCSPTCALGFEGARGSLIGQQGRGLAQLFTMIIGMRLSVGSQGAGIAGAAASLAWSYAAERRQGGRLDTPPPTIDRHGDVQRMLLGSAARAEVARGLVLTASAVSDLQLCEPDADARASAGSLLAWLLPITKNFCAEAAVLCASDAIQVLGGAGYTREWQAEQYLRDARVLPIYEGTSGMQALDLAMRRVLGDDARALRSFTACARVDLCLAGDSASASRFAALLELLEHCAANLAKDTAPTIAYPFLQLASLATTGWIALRLTRLGGNPVNDHLAGLGRHWLRLTLPQARAEAELVGMGRDLVAEFGSVSMADYG